jgi:hypothetical protein
MGQEEESKESQNMGERNSCAPKGPVADRACFESHALWKNSSPAANCTAVMLQWPNSSQENQYPTEARHIAVYGATRLDNCILRHGLGIRSHCALGGLWRQWL